jgi:hypothetical protein
MKGYDGAEGITGNKPFFFFHDEISIGDIMDVPLDCAPPGKGDNAGVFWGSLDSRHLCFEGDPGVTLMGFIDRDSRFMELFGIRDVFTFQSVRGGATLFWSSMKTNFIVSLFSSMDSYDVLLKLESTFSAQFLAGFYRSIRDIN